MAPRKQVKRIITYWVIFAKLKNHPRFAFLGFIRYIEWTERSDMKNDLIDISKLADYLNIHISIIQDMVQKNLIPHQKVNSIPVFNTEDIERWIENSRLNA